MPKPTDKAALEHAARCLRLNPMWQAGEVLESRAGLLGLVDRRAEEQARATRQAEKKNALREQLLKVRAAIWTAPLPQLQKKLDSLPVGSDPDLKPVADRLRVLVATRARLPQLTQDPDFNGDFFECFKQILTGSPRASAAVRERVLTSFDDRRLAQRGRRMIELLRRETPEVCALEDAWLTRLQKKRSYFLSLRSKVQPAERTEARSGGCLSTTWYWWILIYIAIKALVALSRMSGHD